MTYIFDNVLDEIEAALEFAAEFCEAEYETRTASLGNDMSEYVSEPLDRARTLRSALDKLREARKAETPRLLDKREQQVFHNALRASGTLRASGALVRNARVPAMSADEKASNILMDAADYFAATHAKADPRAWEHLLVYAPAMSAETMLAAARKAARGAINECREAGESDLRSVRSAVDLALEQLPLTAPKEG